VTVGNTSLVDQSYELPRKEASIADFKKFALIFKKAGKIEEAKKTLVKCKVMEMK